MKTISEVFTRVAKLDDMFQSADWKQEKHIPFIDAPESVDRGQMFRVTATLGKEIAHPNTTEHHIDWIEMYFLPDGEKFPYEIGKCNFGAHGSSVQGPNTSTVYTHHEASFIFKTDKPGSLMASAYCNIHGLWRYEKKLEINE